MDADKTMFQDVPVTKATIQTFRKMLDIMEEFIINSEAEVLENMKAESEDKE